MVHKDADVHPHHYFRIGSHIWVCHFKLGRLVLASHKWMG
jgi:hypothetical protein